MPESFPGQAGRLDSWKAIADYLQRDIRTVCRWEKTLGLPVRRVPGRPGHSVFAYVSEIEEWLKTTPGSDSQATGAHELQVETSIEPHPEPKAVSWRRWSIAGPVAASALVAAGVVWMAYGARAEVNLVSVRVDKTAIVGLGTDGIELWRHPFAADEIASGLKTPGTTGWMAPDGTVVASVSSRVNTRENRALSGELLWMTRSGRIDRRAELDDRLSFGAGDFAAPWILSDARRDLGAGGRVAIAAYHNQWWPSMVAIVDDHARRTGTFVHAGWVEWVNWLAPNRLLASGFSNEHDGGMVALLDPDALNGQTPTSPGSPFYCTRCGSDRPLRYFVFPRSELNLATNAPFNHAIVEPAADRVIVRTIEVPYSFDSAANTSIDVLYEFTPSMDFVRALYSDRYWDMHRVLERQGKITHTREQCPDRDGPREFQMWEPATGWRTVSIAPPAAH